MTLKEKVLVCELIKASYRRKMFWFWLQLFLMIASLTYVINFHDQPGSIIAVFIFSVVFIHCCRIYTSAFSLGFPWVAKRKQAKTLEQIYPEVKFEDLGTYVHLKDYFKV